MRFMVTKTWHIGMRSGLDDLQDQETSNQTDEERAKHETCKGHRIVGVLKSEAIFFLYAIEIRCCVIISFDLN